MTFAGNVKKNNARGRLLRSYHVKRQKGRCHDCGEKMTEQFGPRQRTLEHLIPLGMGGADCFENTAVTCRQCNSRRNVETNNLLARGHQRVES